MPAEAQEFEVAIVGLGPVGASLAHLLGLQGVRTLVLERESEAYPLPRAVHFDDEIMRVFQWIGVAEELLPLLRVNPGMRFVAPSGELLLDWPRPQEESALGWRPSWRFHQPDLERVLRAALARRDAVTVRAGADVAELEEAEGHVTLRYRRDGRERTARAAYVVGCDGGRSMVRRAIGGGMRDLGFHERWLVVDLILKREKPELGDHTIQFCDPDRPATYVRCPGRRRRWEIAAREDETDEALTKPARAWELLSRWLTPEEAELERAAVYVFHSLIAERWRRGRLLIAGDAAHQTPPFMGQGMCAGIRDAANLGWKLAAVAQGQAGAAILDSYQSERAPNTQEFIETAMRLGRLINAADSEGALRAAIPRPSGGAEMRSIYPPLGPGLGRGPHAGRQFGQPRMRSGARMDDAVGHRPVLVAEAALARAAPPPDGVALVTTEDAPAAAAHLAALEASAALLRPDRYILGCANSPADLAPLYHLLLDRRPAAIA